jgi:hypothetical protein
VSFINVVTALYSAINHHSLAPVSLALVSSKYAHSYVQNSRRHRSGINHSGGRAAYLHIRAHPPPSTMAARQRVLAALREFGDVEHFRSLKVCFIFI